MALESLGPGDYLVGPNPAAADYTVTGQYCFVYIGSAGAITKAGTAGRRCAGVLQNNPDSGEASTVAKSGRTKVVAGEAIANGDLVSTKNDGRAQVADTTGWHVLGTARSACSNDGEVISVELQLPGDLIP